MDSKIDIIILSTYFPPILSVASNRTWAFAKYLSKVKYNVKVITLKEGGKISQYDGIEVFYLENKQWIKRATFNKKYPYVIHKFRALWNRIIAVFNIREYKAWGNSAFKTIDSLIKDPLATVLISSYPVEEVLNVSIRIKRKYPDLKWISDLRDGISTNPFYPERNLPYLKMLEKDMLNNVAGITTVSEPIASHFQKISTKNKVLISEIRNGFDFPMGSKEGFNDCFTISYVGTFYAERNPGIFFHALEQLIREGKIKNINVKFVGTSGGILIPVSLKCYVEVIEKVPYNQAVEIMKHSDALLLVLPTGKYRGVYSGKIFDYLGVMKPIIALVDKEDVAAKLIKDCRAGFIAEWNNVFEAKEAILKAYTLWKEKESLDFNKLIIEKHHRKDQVKQLEMIIDELFAQ